MAFDWKPPKLGAAAKTNTVNCKSCGGTDFDDFCESGDRACSWCGTVLQENGIVSTVQFSESGGSSNVVGQFVSGDKGRPSSAGARGRGRFGYSRDSRDITIHNGKKKIMQILAQLHLRHSLAEPAGRLFSLCVNQNYVQGRRSVNIVAACVYIVCRQQHFPIMLIDLSDKLAVNVYVLGKTFQKLIKYLNLQTTVPIVDPAMYIKRFAAKLDLGSKTNAVCMTALKIIGSMKRDFLATGRQPAGVCCAALTLATRVNRIERSKEEIRKAVNVCETTVRQRLLEFEATPTSQLTVEELNKLPQGGNSFPGVGKGGGGRHGGGRSGQGGTSGTTDDVSVRISEVRMDPPAFIANRIRDGKLKMPWTKPTPPPKKNASSADLKKPRVQTTPRKVASSSAILTKPSTAERQEKAAPGGGKKRLSRRDEVGRGDEGDGVATSSRCIITMTAAKAAVAAVEASAIGSVVTVAEEDSNHDEEMENESSDSEGCGAAARENEMERVEGAVDKGKGKVRGKEVDIEEEEEEEEERGNPVVTGGRKKRRKRMPAPEDTVEEEEEEEEEPEEDDGLLASKMNLDASTDEGREALTRHILRIREVDYGIKKAKSRAKRKRVSSQVYSCLESMFDEDEKHARRDKNMNCSTPKATASAPPTSEQEDQETTADTGAAGDAGSSNGGGKPVAAREAGTKDGGVGGVGGTVGHHTTQKYIAARTKGGYRGMDGDSVGVGNGGETKEGSDWGVYLRTSEDEKRAKVEWETANKDWLQDQEEKMRILAEDLDKSGFQKKKRKYNTSSRTGTETFGEVLQSEAAKNKSLKIDHAALQRVMNLDGSLKQIDENDDDESMEEIEEGDPAPPIPLPGFARGRGFRGGLVKSPLTASPRPLPSPLPAKASVAASTVLPPTHQLKQQKPVNAAATKVLPWAGAGLALDDGGEKAIKDALALLTKGDVGALVSSNTASTVVPPASAFSFATTSKKPQVDTVEEVEEEVEEVSREGEAGTRTGTTGAVEDDDEDEEEEDDDEGMGGGLYGRDDYDDDDPYGEEA